MLKENKGVTLVALVITIIVLLILAGVSISLVAGDNGVLSQAVNSADTTNEATAKEQLEMAISSVQADFFADVWLNNTSVTFKEYCDADALNDYSSSNANSTQVTIKENDGDWGDTNASSSTYTVEVSYKGETYTAILTETTSGTGAYISSWNE